MNNQSRKRTCQESNEIAVFEEESKDKDRIPINNDDIVFDNRNSLINFNRVYHLYYQCLESRDDQMRSQCVRFFVDCHRHKFLHFIDVQGYTKFIVDLFFDPSLDVFNNMTSFKCRIHKSLVILNFALVSKQFFRITSKKINNSYHNIFGYANFDHEYSLIKSPPLFFDYESIKFIRYSESTDRIIDFFSRVELFHIKSDEYDSRINDGVSRRYIYYDSFKPSDNSSSDESLYRDVINRDGYLTHLPPFPNLKNIFVHQYYGYRRNYSLFLISIFENTPNVDGHGIESFYIRINKDWNRSPDYSNMDFLQPLLSLHSKTLKSVTLEYYDFYNDDAPQLLSILKERLPTIKQYNYSFILFANFNLLKSVCQDGEDLEVYQYLLNQQVIFNKFNSYDENNEIIY
ncbi:hypothetical protein PPL_06612 [Heterostelium album PN500]|uniref:Uncharacterized protein n=1 Tax=Heterostelium pallidum (strain ATCC 26659 / Pp 5 / PN500) TaxID=670386 RepID=D3BF79_HETP5|nr:hypothetical protein PPL_06612 [Heterostelium album PN500]EFA79793.1 hypothetical protein PPL_06612 [Heterostelium album PN500]|eukprot:XP_020431914.1 hypothetical protein PPL_06612 [Heterostelium album PN500]